MNLIWVTAAKYIGEYRLQLTFNDGAVKIFDGKEIVMTHPLFKPLQSLAVYKEFVLDGWTVSWSNGPIDLAPEYLYEHSVA